MYLPGLCAPQMETWAHYEKCFRDTSPARPRCPRDFCFRCKDCRPAPERGNFRSAPPTIGRCLPGIFSPLPAAFFHYPGQTSSTAHPVRTASKCETLVRAAPARECCCRSTCGNRFRTAFYLATGRLRL